MEKEEQSPDIFKNADKMKRVGIEKKSVMTVLEKIELTTKEIEDLKVLYDMLSQENVGDEEWKDFEVAPHYLTITLPEAIETNTYFTLCVNNSTSKSVGSNSPYKDFAISLECYDENDNLKTTLKSPRGHYKETINIGMTPAVKLEAGTKKVTFKIYVPQGSVLLFGFSSLKK